MTPDAAEPQEALTIGDLAARTGVAAATLRMWESRHGFPSPSRLESGHRRYDADDVEAVRQVLRRREGGARLEAAIGAVVRARHGDRAAPAAPSVFATLRARHPRLAPQRLRKSTLLALSWAIEDECCARAERPLVFGAFQASRFYRASEARWRDIARTSRATVVLASLGDDVPVPAGTTFVDLPEDAPMRREWAVVCDAADHPALLTAWELPGQDGVADGERVFEALWTVEPGPVRDAARACARLADELGHAEGRRLLDALDADPPEPPYELVQAGALLNRVVAYVDRLR